MRSTGQGETTDGENLVMSMRQIVLMNDTDAGGQHFGCARVMHVIRDALSGDDTDSICSIPVGTAWQQDAELTRRIERADILVVNGEGTLHHGKRRGKWLLAAAERAAQHGARTFLINAMWQDNPEDWHLMVRSFDKVWCRDSRSARALSEILKEPVAWLGDLSMCSDMPEPPQTDRCGIVIGDSVISSVSRQLDTLSRQLNDPALLIPLLTQKKFIAPELTGMARLFRKNVSRFATWRAKRLNPRLQFLPSEKAYAEVISQSSLSVTGRFHAVCIAIATRTPFVALSSNSHKIEALIDDLGLNKARLVRPDELNAQMLVDRDWQYSDLELERILENLGRWRQEAQGMFAEIRSSTHRK